MQYTIDNILEEQKNRAEQELLSILGSKLRSHQYEVTWSNSSGFVVYLKYFPPDLKIPSKLSYWNINIMMMR